MAKRSAVGPSAKKRERNRGAMSQRGEMSRVRIPASLIDAIEIERDTLARAQSILRCLKISLESEDCRFDGPYYPDIAGLASELLREASNGLDIVNLEKSVAGSRSVLRQSRIRARP
jgi:hypothetical protein